MPGPPGPAGNSKIGLTFALFFLDSVGLGREGEVTRMHPLLLLRSPKAQRLLA